MGRRRHDTSQEMRTAGERECAVRRVLRAKKARQEVRRECCATRNACNARWRQMPYAEVPRNEGVGEYSQVVRECAARAPVARFRLPQCLLDAWCARLPDAERVPSATPSSKGNICARARMSAARTVKRAVQCPSETMLMPTCPILPRVAQTARAQECPQTA